MTFDVHSFSDQVIHGFLRMHMLNKVYFLSIVYAAHTFVTRRPLWSDLIHLSKEINLPWLTMGDFNAIKEPANRMGSSSTWIPSFNDFSQCLSQAGLDDLRYVGHRFTWSTRSGLARKQRKIDRALINVYWSGEFSFSEAAFLAPGVSDHTPILIRIDPHVLRRKPFKIFNFWTTHPDYHHIVAQIWNSQSIGTPMFDLCRRLKNLKIQLKALNRQAFSDISRRTGKVRGDLKAVQDALVLDPTNVELSNRERILLQTFSTLRLNEESFYCQKSRIRWLKEGDLNMSFFHHSVNKRHLQNRLLSVTDGAGNLLTDLKLIQDYIVSFYKDLLALALASNPPALQDLRSVIAWPLNPA